MGGIIIKRKIRLERENKSRRIFIKSDSFQRGTRSSRAPFKGKDGAEREVFYLTVQAKIACISDFTCM